MPGAQRNGMVDVARSESTAGGSPAGAPAGEAAGWAREALVQRVHERFLGSIDGAARPATPGTSSRRRAVAAEVSSAAPLLEPQGAQQVVDEVLARLGGVGRLAELWQSDDVTEVLINGPGPVTVERHGRLEPAGDVSEAEVSRLVEHLLGPTGRRVDRRTPVVDVRLDDRTRCSIVVPPVAVNGPYVALRRFPSSVRPLSQFADPATCEHLSELVVRRANLLVIGGTSSGKTSLVASLLAEHCAHERVVIIEAAAELPRLGSNFVRLEAQQPNIEGAGGVSLAQLVVAALRLRPDRLLVGEVRGAEAAELLNALSTGHRGSLSTLHADDGATALWRLEQLARAGGLSGDVAGHIARTFDACVVMRRGEADPGDISGSSGGRRTVVDLVPLAPDAGQRVP